MEKIYDSQTIEAKWRNFWENNTSFAVQQPEINLDPELAYCIMLPPPNVTGNLHMGHAFQHTIMDLLIRFKKMQGNHTLWQPGMDHAGISTQMVVERQLNLQNIKRTDLSREDFVGRVWQWKEQYGGIITKQMQRLGTAIDWSRSKFTLDPEFSAAVKQVFIQLYREGLIYKGKKLVNWDPSLKTAISDLEVVTEEVVGHLWYIKYPLVGADNAGEHVVIATTRPETLLGDVAVCVNPEDSRYKHLIGKQVMLPIMNKQIPIIADSYVEQTFGTGCLKITPAHDWNDYTIGVKHNLPVVNIFTPEIKLNDTVPQDYQGLTREAARKKILQDLQQQQLLLKTEDYITNIPKSTNTNQIVEPYLTDQWFVKMEPLAKPAIDAVINGDIEFVPVEWKNNYLEWLTNIQDWCISRQLWWGHQIPAWYDQTGAVYVGEDEQAVRKFYNLADDITLQQDADVLDTWFSSALWPFVTLGWPDKTVDLAKFFPTDVLVTGFDIIFFWVARMVMMSLKFTGKIPFKQVYVHGIIQDQDGQKMSKSKGNVIDPIDLVDGISLEDLVYKRTKDLMQPQFKQSIEKKTRKQFPDGINCFGTDALRFTFCSLATHNRHIKFELSRLEGYRNFCNKLWNASRFILLHLKDQQFDLRQVDSKLVQKLNQPEQWILSIWQQAKQNIINHFANYRFDLASKDIYEFIWNEYCDWYVEFAKIALTDANKSELDKNPDKNQVKVILIFILDEVLKVLHPIMPYITEEIWETISANLGSNNILLNQQYPQAVQDFINLETEQSIAWVKKFITIVRNLKAEKNIAPKVILPQVFIKADLAAAEQKYLLTNQDLIKKLAKIGEIIITDDVSSKKGAITAVISQTELWVPMAGLIDHGVEKDRLHREIAKLQKQLEVTTKKLNNPAYAHNAPADIVAKEQQKQANLQAAIKTLENNISELVGYTK
jgi:valyl-tRNA synthetase